ncbi:prepilin-type N-terminal cleavage/methylation domain-containing protein [bacterium]|nr:prepilin-type N-terminal cleavage/methylation domain-containing protein [bacterium]
MFRFMKKDRGFSLVELLAVIIIMTILAAIAVPIYLRHTERAKASEPKANIRALKQSYDTYFTTNGTTDGYEVEDALDDAGISQAVRDKWEFDVIGQPPTEYITKSTSEYESGEGKEVRYVVAENKYYGWGTDTFTDVETGGED